MLPLICDYAVANPREVNAIQHFIENKLWITELLFYKDVATVRIEMNSFYSEIKFHINSRLVFEIREKVTFFSENEEALLGRIKRFHHLIRELNQSFKNFETTTVFELRSAAHVK